VKKLTTIFILLCFHFLIPKYTIAEDFPTQVFINGNKLNSEVNPQIINGSTFVPLRAIAEALNFKVSWNSEQRKVTLQNTAQNIEFKIGSKQVNANGKNLSIETCPYIVEGSTMIPVRFIGEQLNLRVSWDATMNSVLLNDTSIPKIANLTTQINHVVVVIEENHSYDQIVGGSHAPYMQTLIQRGALFTKAHGVTHPSQPNYLALFSGSTQGVKDDSCKKPFAAPNLASELLDSHSTFTGYSEDLPQAGYTGCSSKGYARKHNPWVQFSNVPDEANRPFSDFPQDFSTLPTVSFVVPNRQNDMHDGTVKQADDWLRSNLDSYVAWAQEHQSLLIVTWDEDDFVKDNHIPLIIVGPMVKPGVYDENINHLNVLRTIEDLYYLAELNGTNQIDPISSIWK
jgi:hypothetical protein